MKAKTIEKTLVVVLFLLVLIVFSLAEKDSKKLDRLYKTAQLLQKTKLTPTVQAPPAPFKTARN